MKLQTIEKSLLLDKMLCAKQSQLIERTFLMRSLRNLSPLSAYSMIVAELLELLQSPILCCASPIVYEVLPWHSVGKASSSKLRDNYMGHCQHCWPCLMVVCQTLSSFSYNPGSVYKENLRSVRKKRGCRSLLLCGALAVNMKQSATGW